MTRATDVLLVVNALTLCFLGGFALGFDLYIQGFGCLLGALVFEQVHHHRKRGRHADNTD